MIQVTMTSVNSRSAMSFVEKTTALSKETQSFPVSSETKPTRSINF